MNKIILDLCGGTGSWSKPYKEAGYDVKNITLPEYDVRLYIPPENVYGILAAPPCTEFSLARNGINKYMSKAPKRNLQNGMDIVDVCYKIINYCNPLFWALENPVGLLCNYLGKPNYIFHPWWFGDPWTKRTALWGKFNNPEQEYFTQENCIKSIGMPIKEYFKEQRISCPIRKNKILPSRADMDKMSFKFVGMGKIRSAFRAITPQGFAKAFFEANK